MLENAEELNITSSEIYDKKTGNYHPSGLFSEQIFGPIKDNTCQCGIVRMASNSTRCNKCNVQYTKSTRSTKGGYIHLPFKIINPIALYLLYNYDSSLKNKVAKYSTDVMDQLFEIVNTIISKKIENVTIKEMKIRKLYDNSPDLVFLEKIYVIPPELRPVTGNSISYIADELNHYYQNILSHLEQLKIEEIPKIEYHQLVIMKTIYDMYIESIINKVSQRSGIIRQKIFGKRVDFSGRTVATVEPTLNLDTIRVPYKLLCSIYAPFIFFSHPQSSIEAYVQITNYINDKELHPELKSTINKIANNIPVIINRQPTLHRGSMRGFNVIPTEALTIQVNPYIVDGFNLDFDGDQLAIYAPLFEEEIQEYKTKFINSKNQIIPGNLRFNSISQFGYCVYYMSKDEPQFDENLTKYEFDLNLPHESKIEFADSLISDYNEYKKSIIIIHNGVEFLTTKGRFVLSCYMDLWIDEPITKGKFDSIATINILNIVEKRGHDFHYDDMAYLDKLLHNHLLNIPVTISIRDFTDIFSIPEYSEAINKLENSVRSNETKTLISDIENIIKNNISETGNINSIIKSGAKGNFGSIRQLMISKGNVMTPQKTMVKYRINRNLVKGLSKKDMYIMSFGARKGSLDRSVNTADTGYLMRKLIFAMDDVEHDISVNDCGTTNFIQVKLTKDMYKAYIFRNFSLFEDYKEYKKDDIITLTYNNYNEFIDMDVRLWSPIHCKNKHICKKCYGTYDKLLNSRYIGIIGAQSIGERCTQLTMRTFHTGGVAEDIRDFINTDLLDINGDLLTMKSTVLIDTIDTNIDISNLVSGYELEDDVYLIESITGRELHIPKGCILRSSLKSDSKLIKNTELATIPLNTVSTVTSIVDYVMKQIEMPPEGYKYEELYELLINAFYKTEGIISIHLEVLISQMMRSPKIKGKHSRLCENPEDYVIVSIKNIPAFKKLLALGYQYFHRNLINNLTENYESENDNLTIMEKVIKGIDLKFVKEGLDSEELGEIKN